MIKFFPSAVVPRMFIMLLVATILFSCKNDQKQEENKDVQTADNTKEELFFDISLAQWSLNEAIFSGELDPMDFAQKSNELGFTGIEYVSAFYQDYYKDAEDPEAALQKVLDTLKAKSEEYDVRNVLIMVDREGNLAVSNEEERNQAVENHKKWVDAAQFLGCHSIRVNLNGSNDPEEWKANSVAALTSLSEYAAQKDINIIVENHGGLSSNAELLVEVMEEVNLPNCGTLPDFGNFCIEGSVHDCEEEYPKYKGVKLMMPYAKAVSAKSYDFNEEGEAIHIDYPRMLEIVKEAGYTGFIGVEYEGSEMPAEEGILATKELLIEAGSNLSN